MQSSIIDTLIQSKQKNVDAGGETAVETAIEEALDDEKESAQDNTQDPTQSTETEKKTKAPRKLVEDEGRAVGRIGQAVWKEYLGASGGKVFWGVFILSLVIASLSPVAENGWIKYVDTRALSTIY